MLSVGRRRRRLSCRGRFREHKVGEVFKQPFILERSIDDSQKFTSQCDDRFSGPPAFLLFVVGLQVRAVALRDQGALYQRGSAQLGPAFGNSAECSVSLELLIFGTMPK